MSFAKNSPFFFDEPEDTSMRTMQAELNRLVADPKHYTGYSESDYETLLAFHELIKNDLDGVIDVFYHKILENPFSRNLLEESGSSVAKLSLTLRSWLEQLISLPLDNDFVDRQLRIGSRHVEVKLPQSFMVLGCEIIRHELKNQAFTKITDTTQLHRTLDAMDRTLDIALSLMLYSYQRDREALLKDKVLLENENILAMGRMSASIAHEVKNPLAGISGAVDVLAKRLKDDSENLEILSLVKEQISRLGRTVNDLLEFAKPLHLHLQTLALEDVISSAEALIQQDPDRSLTLNFDDHESRKLLLHVDPLRLQNVFMNLFINACDAMRSPVEITISARHENDMTHITIEDNGTGIDGKILPNLFKPFVTNKTHGTGLGLAICKKIIESHGGAITLEPSTGGARFSIRLPHHVEDEV